MKGKFRSLIKLALPYLLCIMIPLIAIAFLSRTLSVSYHERAVEKETESIQHAFERFSDRARMVKELADTLANTRVVSSYAYDSFMGVPQSFLDGKEMQSILDVFLINNIASTAYYFDLANDRIISPYGVLSDPSLFYSYDYRMREYSAEEAIRRVKEGSWGRSFSPAMTIRLPNGTAEMIEYQLSVPVSMARGFTGRLVLAMKTEKLLDDLFSCVQDGGEFYVFDASGKLFYASGSAYGALEPEMGRLSPCGAAGMQGIYGIQLRSADGEWTARVFTQDVFWRAGVWDHLIVWIVVVLLILLSLAICIFFTMKNMRELQRIIESLRISPAGGENEPENIEVSFRVIQEYAEKLASENSAFIKNMDALEKTRQNALLLRLIRHDWEEEAEIRQLTRDGKISLPEDRKYVVLLLHFEGPSYRMRVSEEMTAKDLAKDLVMTYIYEPFGICDVSSREIVFLIVLNRAGDYREYLHKLSSMISVEVKYKYDIDLRIGISDTAESIFEIDRLYRQASEVIQYCQASQNELVLYSDFAQLKDVYYFPQNSSEKMRNFVAVGKAEEAREILRGIYHINFEQHTDLSAAAIRSIRELVVKNLADIAQRHDLPCGGALKQLEEEGNVQRFFEEAGELLDQITGAVREKNRLSDHSPIARIMDYINRHYCESELSLKTLSQEFDFSESYISTLFKATYEKPISSFIEELRIRRACELITGTEQKISDVAEKTGYSSDTSFRRAFKKVTGLSPIEYKNTIEKKNGGA